MSYAAIAIYNEYFNKCLNFRVTKSWSFIGIFIVHLFVAVYNSICLRIVKTRLVSFYFFHDANCCDMLTFFSGGSLFLFYRKDGHNCRKKRDGKAVKEAHEKLKACKFLDEKWNPKFTVIKAQKNHHTKFFQKGSSDNVPPGTIIDNQVCHPRINDFYLCAHAGMIVSA
ncbi:protein argonaute 1-like [Silene latifolia]|uniref:protein argonaute 1-like n=1 Tax=Silene latifolia TaxID=37657 RepID=UPI003D788978